MAALQVGRGRNPEGSCRPHCAARCALLATPDRAGFRQTGGIAVRSERV